MKLAETNLNDYIHVKLNDRGRTILINRHDKLNETLKNCLPPLRIEVDNEGYSKFQMWDFMAIFGGYMGMGQQLPFSTTVKVELE